jgi:hypothetical protein
VTGRDLDAVQLRAVAPLVNASTNQLLGPVMIANARGGTDGSSS